MRLRFYSALIAFAATTQIFSDIGAQAISLGAPFELAEVGSCAIQPKKTTLEESEETTYDPVKKERCVKMTKKILYEFLKSGELEEAVKLQDIKREQDVKKLLDKENDKPDGDDQDDSQDDVDDSNKRKEDPPAQKEEAEPGAEEESEPAPAAKPKKDKTEIANEATKMTKVFSDKYKQYKKAIDSGKLSQCKEVANKQIARVNDDAQKLITEKIQLVNSAEYLKKNGADAGDDQYAFFQAMTKDEIQTVMRALTPVVTIKDGSATTKYLIGTKPHNLDNSKCMLRVGGGYASIEDHLNQVSPFENIDIYKQMKKDGLSFKEAVSYWLKKKEASKSVIDNWNKAAIVDQIGDIFVAGMKALDAKTYNKKK